VEEEEEEEEEEEAEEDEEFAGLRAPLADRVTLCRSSRATGTSGFL
jgi:hypothetical protein